MIKAGKLLFVPSFNIQFIYVKTIVSMAEYEKKNLELVNFSKIFTSTNKNNDKQF